MKEKHGIKVGTLVSLHNIFPPEAKGGMGIVEEIQPEAGGFHFGVREFYDDKLYFHHSSTIRPFKCVEIEFDYNYDEFDSTLPMAIRIAAKCVGIDKVKVEQLSEEPCFAYRPEIRVLRIGNWEERLASKSAAHLTNHIERMCELTTKGNKPILRLFMLGNIKEEKSWAYNDMVYDLQAT